MTQGERNNIRRYYFLSPCHKLNRKGGGGFTVRKQALNYRFHNPNTAEATADYIVKILLETNRGKVEQAIHTDRKSVV